MGALDLRLETEEAVLLVDGQPSERNGQFDGSRGSVFLTPGMHEVTLENPEGESWSERIRVIAGSTVELRVELVN